jgi:pyruvate dehydrogenase (quinone)
MMDCDTLLMIGSSFPYPEFLPKEGQARGIQIDIDGRMLSIRYPMELNLKGDSKTTLRALIPYLEYKKERYWRRKIERGISKWWQLMEARSNNTANPLNPEKVFWELSKRLPDNAILTSDSGSSANWFARDIKIRDGMMCSLSGNLATMGPGVPYAISAKFAYPDRCVVAMVGDGAMQMNGNEGLITISKYWKEWSDPRLVVLVLNNRDLNQVTWEQRAMAGDPRFPGSQSIPDFPYAEYALELGLTGIKVDHPDQIGLAWDRALGGDRPAVIEAITDPDVPPLPPHISIEQAKAFASSVLGGDADALGFIKQTVKQVADSFLPHSKEKGRSR